MLARWASCGRFLEDGHGGDWEEGPQFSLLCAKLRGESQKFECCQIKLHSPQQLGRRGLGTAKRQRTQERTQDRGTAVMAGKQGTMPGRCLEVGRRERLGQVKKNYGQFGGGMLERAPPPTTVPLEDIALQRGRRGFECKRPGL